LRGLGKKKGQNVVRERALTKTDEDTRKGWGGETLVYGLENDKG